MPERSVAFYAIESDFLSVAVKSVEKMYTSGRRVLLLCDLEEEVKRFDSTLWTFSKVSFIPHGSRYSMKPEDAVFCDTWISTKMDLLNDPVCLIHNGLHIQRNDLLRFSIVIDIFNRELLVEAKERSKSYRDAQFLQQKLWIQKRGGGWEAGDEP
ncbi:MAG: DNA polymerase III subunit chi [Holosporales bacterium]|jgi:DNA polymerase IIIc chi subunit|nr:DNA polymerase III subunit chi [Holosporales bacterium]